MDYNFYIGFEIASIMVLAASVIGSVLYSRSKKDHKWDFSTLHFLTAGVFLAAFLIFIPVYYRWYAFEDNYTWIRPLLLAMHNSLRMFILDGEFDIIVSSLMGAPTPLHVAYSFYAAVLYVVAPVLTFSNILSLFKDLHEMWRLKRNVSHPIYVFSELNDISVAVARSVLDNYAAAKTEIERRKAELKQTLRAIAASADDDRERQKAAAKAEARSDIEQIKRRHGVTGRKPVLVFTDVFTNNDEVDYELQQKAHELHAICLKRDIVRILIPRRDTRVEYFLLGVNESENIEQAINLTESNKQYNNRSIYLYSSKQSAGLVLDSVPKGVECVNSTLINKIDRDPYEFLRDRVVPDDAFDNELYVRRINHGELMAMKTLLKPDFLEMFRFDTVSITILGAGGYGKHFLQTAIWLYQETNHKLEINIFDSERATDNGLLKRLRKEMPEIITDDSGHYVRDKVGDCCYDIQFFLGADFYSSDFEDTFYDPRYNERLKRTQLIIVALGDDDRNIEAAISMRALFDRLNGLHKVNKQMAQMASKPLSELREEELPYRLPYIDAIVFDEKKSANLSIRTRDGSQRGIVNCKQEPININFIGSLREQYSYDILNEYKALERMALRYHIEWMYHDKQQELAEYESRSADAADDVVWQQRKVELKANLYGALQDYASFEYFRRSSISRALHQRMLQRIHSPLVNLEVESPIDEQQNLASSVLEHARWNAFMRVMGYSYAPLRNDRGMVHNDLVLWDELNGADKAKDHKIDEVIK